MKMQATELVFEIPREPLTETMDGQFILRSSAKQFEAKTEPQLHSPVSVSESPPNHAASRIIKKRMSHQRSTPIGTTSLCLHSSCTFLDLAAELRNNVYFFALVETNAAAVIDENEKKKAIAGSTPIKSPDPARDNQNLLFGEHILPGDQRQLQCTCKKLDLLCR